MNKHVSHNKLLDVFLDEDRSKHQDVFEHLATCESCSKAYQAMAILFTPRDNDAIDTSQKLDNAIRKAVRTREVGLPGITGFAKIWSLLGQSAKIMVSGAVLGMAVVLFMGDVSRFGARDLATLYYNKGEIRLNNTAVTGKNKLQEKNIIQTGAHTFAHIRFQDNSVVTIGENTSLEIVNKKVPGIGTKELSWSSFIHVRSGTIHCAFRHERVKITYSLKTPQAYIDTIGTEFYLTSTDTGSSLILTEGKVRVRTTAGDHMLKADNKNKYILTGTIAMAQVSTADARIMESFAAYNGSLDGDTVSNSAGNTKDQNSSMKDMQEQKKDVQERMRDTKRELRKNMRDQRKEMNNMKRHMKKERRQSGKKN